MRYATWFAREYAHHDLSHTWCVRLEAAFAAGEHAAAAYAAAQLSRLGPLPMRVDAMSTREYAIYGLLAQAIAVLQTLAEHGGTECT
mgnify:FL=1